MLSTARILAIPKLSAFEVLPRSLRVKKQHKIEAPIPVFDPFVSHLQDVKRWNRNGNSVVKVAIAGHFWVD